MSLGATLTLNLNLTPQILVLEQQYFSFPLYLSNNFSGAEFQLVGSDDHHDHTDEHVGCGNGRCKPENYDPGSENTHNSGQSGEHGSRPSGSGGHGSFGDISGSSGFNTPGGLTPGNSDHNHHHDHSDSTNISDFVGDGLDLSNPFGPDFAPKPPSDISSSLDLVTGLLGGSQPDVPIAANFPTDDDEDDIFSVAVDTTASDISAISLPISSSISVVPSVPQVSVVNSPPSSVSSSTSSSPSTTIAVSQTSWITFSTTQNTYNSFFSYRPCITIYVPEMATIFLKKFNVIQKEVTLCFSLPPFF